MPNGSATQDPTVAPRSGVPLLDAARRAEILAHLGRRCRELLEPVLQETLQHSVAALREHAETQAGTIDGVALQRAAARLQDDAPTLAARVLEHVEAQARAVGAAPERARFGEPLRLVEEDDLLDHLAVHRTAAAACRPHHGVPQQFLRRLAALRGSGTWRGERAPFAPAALAAALNEVLAADGQGRTQRELALAAFGRALGRCALRFYGALDELLAAHRIEPIDADAARPRRVDANAHDAPPAAAPGPLASLDTIGDALAARRRVLGAPAANGSGPVLAGVALDKVLENLQRAGVSPRSADAVPAPVKQRIASYLSGDPANPPAAQFERRAGDTIEFVDLVFEHLLRHGAGAAPAQAMLRHLEIPTLRVALNDAAFFSDPQHPARRLLNVVSEIALYWLDPQRSDSELHKLTRTALDQIAQQRELSDDLFAEIADRLARALDRLGQRAHVLESRLVARAVAQEKLELARRRAAAVCGEFCADLEPGSPRRVFLESTWKDVLVLTLLRSGVTSERWRERTDAARWLARAPGQTEGLSTPQFRRIAEQAITLLGFQPAEIESQLEKLLLPEPAPTVRGSAVAAAEKAPSAASGPKVAPAPRDETAADRAMPAPFSADERRVCDQLRTIPFGSWFEFRRADKTCERQKLAWYSTVTERCLFVAPDGKRAQYRSMDDLARAVVRNEARVLDVAPRSWFDRAWRTVTDGLRAFLAPETWDPTRA